MYTAFRCNTYYIYSDKEVDMVDRSTATSPLCYATTEQTLPVLPPSSVGDAGRRVSELTAEVELGVKSYRGGRAGCQSLPLRSSWVSELTAEVELTHVVQFESGVGPSFPVKYAVCFRTFLLRLSCLFQYLVSSVSSTVPQPVEHCWAVGPPPPPPLSR